MPVASTYSLALWVLHGKHCGDGYGFPFDRPLLDFAQRLLELYRRLPELLDLLLTDEDPCDKQPIFKLACEVSYVGNDLVLCRTVEELRWRSLLFDRLRKAMRIAPVDGDDGLNDKGTAEAMSTIRQAVEKFRRQLEQDSRLAADPLCIKMSQQIDKYGDKLFADPIVVDTPSGPLSIYPQRTNNILEQFFGQQKQSLRRRVGRSNLGRDMEDQPAQVALTANLRHTDYVRILCGSLDNLPDAFADLDATILDVIDRILYCSQLLSVFIGYL